ncbi:hypothetical protein [Rhodoferax sp.]|uniref:hypothetical protein n=1 Tax=Rhodoferax sp. TaxID=50421 RepID=UPI002ACEDF41|nr:hypothetical protein [Rhodoferax sp.]MDZ7918482.1 hypothetical protein [Rhodoferax sp.]
MKKSSITLRAYSGKPLAETTGYAYDIDGVTLVVHPAHIFSHRHQRGDGLRVNKPKGLWQVSEPESGATATATGDGITFKGRQEAIAAAQLRIEAHGGADTLRKAIALSLKRYAESLV